MALLRSVKTRSPRNNRPWPTIDNTDSSDTRCYSLVINDQEIRYAMAPIVGASDYAFRMLVRGYSDEPILGYTLMLHTKKLLQDKTFRRNHLDICDDWNDDQPQFLSHSQLTCIEGIEDIGIAAKS
jgi:hypothetical protein